MSSAPCKNNTKIEGRGFALDKQVDARLYATAANTRIVNEELEESHLTRPSIERNVPRFDTGKAFFVVLLGEAVADFVVVCAGPAALVAML